MKLKKIVKNIMKFKNCKITYDADESNTHADTKKSKNKTKHKTRTKKAKKICY